MVLLLTRIRVLVRKSLSLYAVYMLHTIWLIKCGIARQVTRNSWIKWSMNDAHPVHWSRNSLTSLCFFKIDRLNVLFWKPSTDFNLPLENWVAGVMTAHSLIIYLAQMWNYTYRWALCRVSPEPGVKTKANRIKLTCTEDGNCVPSKDGSRKRIANS